MWTGRKTLSSIDHAVSELRGELTKLDESILRANEQLIARRRDHGEQIKRLARLRAELLDNDQVISGIDQADRQAQQILDLRRADVEALQAQILDNESETSRHERERAQATERLAALADQIDDLEAKTQQRLADDEDYQSQLKRAHEADEVALEAEAKAQQADNDRKEKGKPYEDDPLFMYLWRRRFGTSEYDANPLVRFLDNKVARVCGYHKARPNYGMLNEIPKRLGEHATAVRATATEMFDKLAALEERALTEDGIDALRSEEHRLEQVIAAADEAIQENEIAFRDLTDRRSHFASGRDPHFQQVITVLTNEFQRDDVRELRRQAELTRPPDDDAVVVQLHAIEQDIDTLSDTLDEHKDIYARNKGRLQELEEIRREFKRNRYDDTHSVFADNSMLGAILGQFLGGLITSDSLWRTIRRNQRFERRRADPGFGSGGFNFPGGVWRSTRRRSGFPGFGFPGKGRSSRGGIGGGGFRTGGGI